MEDAGKLLSFHFIVIYPGLNGQCWILRGWNSICAKINILINKKIPFFLIYLENQLHSYRNSQNMLVANHKWLVVDSK